MHDDREMEWKEEYTVYYTYVLYFMMVNLYGTDVLGVCVCVCLRVTGIDDVLWVRDVFMVCLPCVSVKTYDRYITNAVSTSTSYDHDHSDQR